MSPKCPVPQVPCPKYFPGTFPFPWREALLNLSHSGREQENSQAGGSGTGHCYKGYWPRGQEACSQKGPGMLWQAGIQNGRTERNGIWLCGLAPDCLTCPVQWHTHHTCTGHWWHKEHVLSVVVSSTFCIMSFNPHHNLMRCYYYPYLL